MSSFRHALGEIGRRFPTATSRAASSGRRCTSRCSAMGLGDRADEAIAAYRADYTTRGWSMNSVFDGIPALLADLRAAGVRLAVATSKAEPTATADPRALRARRPLRGDRRCQRRRHAFIEGRRARARAGAAGAAAGTGASWSATVGTTSKAPRRTASTPWSSNGATAQAISMAPGVGSRAPARGVRRRPAGGARCLSRARHVRLLGQHLPVSDGGEDVRPPDRRARPVRRGAGDQRGHRRLARR